MWLENWIGWSKSNEGESRLSSLSSRTYVADLTGSGTSVGSNDYELAETASPRIRANRDQQLHLEASLQEANAILSQLRTIRDDVATITATALDMTEYPEKSELPERKAFVKTFIRDIVVMPGKATIHYKVPIVKDSPNLEGDSEELDLAGPPKLAAGGVR